MKKCIIILPIIIALVLAVPATLSLTVEVTDTTAPLVTIESPNKGDILYGIADIYGTIIEDTELSHYNISIYPGNADFNDFSLRLEQKTKYVSVGFNNQQIYIWDTTTYAAGEYLIRLAARDKAGNRDLSGDAWLGGDDSQHVIKVVVVDKYVGGGGQILEKIGAKKKDWFKISFGGAVGDAGSAGFVGDWQINFHNVGVDLLDKAKFHTTSITQMNFYPPGGGDCTGAMNFYAFGKLNGVPNYKIRFRAGDSPDTVRVELYNPDGVKIYDTHDGDFNDESDCVGSARTGLDNGDIVIMQ